MSRLGKALRKKFKTPQEAARALGIDEKLLTVPRLALDQWTDEHDPKKVLSEEKYREMKATARDEEEQAALDEWCDHARDVLRRHGHDEDEIERAIDEAVEGGAYKPESLAKLNRRYSNGHDRHARAKDGLPHNGLEGGMGGRFAPVNRMGRDRRLAHDSHIRREAERRSAERWGPEAERISVDYSGVQPSLTIAMDKQAGRSSRNAHERWGIGA